MFTLEQLSDREQIREAIFRYSHGMDRLDADWMKSAFWPDATDHHGKIDGNAWELIDVLVPAHERWRATSHSTTNHQIVLDDDGRTARAESYVTTCLVDAHEPVIYFCIGRYLDQFEKRGKEWRIRHRVAVLEARTQLPVVDAPESMSPGGNDFRSGSFDRPSSGRPIGP